MKTLDEIMNAEYEKERNSKKGLIISVVLGGLIGIVGGCLIIYAIFRAVCQFFVH